MISPVPGLPDDVFEDDGLITKRHLRASALAHLRPAPGELLWDIGMGAGSIAIEWARAAEGCRAIGVEQREERAARIRRNIEKLAPGAVEVVVGDALPTVLSWEETPDAIFIGGGGTAEVIDACVAALREGGRLVAHGVTAETEIRLLDAHSRYGGELARIAVEQLEPLATWRAWKPLRTVVAWSVVK
ncbi:precorrin-6Y C5,15-methyltransferase (decarboxylating) subunit CbiT [Tessaracoccus massiliensis]|uniref:precorrin-6Y C5,15-methyltransferase (decarboxylating) subunit CbiT n=1 Tax=Tessaracoccus massiliensis TaxID=1522311 RepID=UPI000694A940|nr:precorrin-6Y C5,15-methyltransferase (decarboxylating) subunit CbiT [Tessaracoccus massiliensis]